MPEGSYTGRLAFDPETEFHTDPDGNPVVTDDEGKTWRYAIPTDLSHNSRYHENFADVDPTANRLAELALSHGMDAAEEMLRQEQPHHYEVQPDDPHFARITHHTDKVAPSVTSHTDAWKDA